MTLKKILRNQSQSLIFDDFLLSGHGVPIILRIFQCQTNCYYGYPSFCNGRHI